MTALPKPIMIGVHQSKGTKTAISDCLHGDVYIAVNANGCCVVPIAAFRSRLDFGWCMRHRISGKE